MDNYSEGNHNKKNLLIMREALSLINYETMEMKMSASLTILGDLDINERNGLIFWAYDIGEKEIARELLRFAMYLLMDKNFNEKIDTNTEANIKYGINLCHEIDYKLQLGVLNKVTIKGLVNCWIDTIKSKKRR